jgi:hypothetical protein
MTKDRLAVLTVLIFSRLPGASVAQPVERLICNQLVGGSNPSAGSNNMEGISKEGFPSGQREQTVNLSATPSEVRILPPPPNLIVSCV